MKEIYTRILSSLVFAMVLVSTASAQNVNTMTVNSPMDIAGDYTIQTASFGDQSGAMLTGDLMLGDDNMAIDSNGDGNNTGTTTDGCEAITNDVSASIVVLDRGECFFGTKAENAEAAMSVALLVCNNDTANPDALLQMGPGQNGEGENTTNLAVMASYNTCQTIKAAMANGTVNVTFSYVEPDCAPVVYGPEVIWGANGEGAFDGGLNDWTVDKGEGTSLDDGGWYWDVNGQIDRGAYNSTQPTIASPTQCNGAMVFDSDYYDNLGTAGAFGSGPCPSDGNIFCEGMLMSPVIDVAASNPSGLILQWHQAIRHFNSLYFLLLSTDGGVTWQDTIQINEEFATNGPHNLDDVQNIPLCGYNDATDFRFAFLYLGYYYYWAIDDVVLINEGNADVRANETWYAIAPNYRTPMTQVTEVPFMIDVENLGNKDVENVAVNVSILNTTTLTEVYSDQLDYGTVPGCFLDENRVFPNTFDIPEELAGYRGTYTVTADNDEVMTNNEQTFDFEVTEDVFAKVLPEAEGGGLVGITPSASYWSVGNYYYVPNGAGYVAKTINVGIGNDPSGASFSGFVNVVLYKWIDLNGDGTCNGNERIPIGQGDLIVQNSLGTALRDMQVDLVHPDGVSPVALEDNTSYVAIAHMNPISAADPVYSMLAADSEEDRNFYYFPMAFAFDTGFGVGRYGSMFGTGSDGSDIDSRDFGPFYNFAVYAPLKIEKMSSGTEDLNTALDIEVFPNPASEFLFVDVALENNSPNFSLELVNLAGKVVHRSTYSNVSKERFEINLQNIETGIYMMNIRSEDGFTSKKVVVQK